VPQNGEIQVGETRINHLGESDRRAFRIKEVGQVFQAFELLEYLSVIENVLLGSIIDPNIVKDARERAADLLASVGLSHKTHSKPAQLSHGERQRVAVCRAMLNDPKLLLADEPTGNLDQSNKQKVVDLLIKQAKQHHSTLLMVTHDNSLLDSFERVIDFEGLTGARS
jgi:putative ABC transport system ATP-binding protein